jgi:diaminopimelate epimerase
MELAFSKMNGAGNDFVVLDNRDGKLLLDSARVAQLCDRHRGIGADGLLVVEPASRGADFRMRYYNADGNEAEMCGNGARCFARFTQRFENKTDKISFETISGIIRASFSNSGEVCVAMSDPHSHRPPANLEINGRTLEVYFINTGVPHAVVFVGDLDTIDVRRDGAALRYHPDFAPKGANANFVQVLAASSVAIRTYERGVEDETLACGTGVCAAALLQHLRAGSAPPISVTVRGGDLLRVGFERSGDKLGHVTLTGPADFVFEGAISL